MNKSETKSSTFLLGEDIEINRLGYGAMQLTGKGVNGDMEDRSIGIKILQYAVDNGVNFIDTAEAYGPETNERLIADALHPYKAGLTIATKGGFDRPSAGQWIINGKPERIAEEIEGSLKRLKVDCIDLWQLHRIDPNVPVEETLTPVAEAVKAGKIKHVGLSEVKITEIEQAEKVVPIVSVQNYYNLHERKWEAEVDYCAKRNMAFIPWYPLASGPHKLQDKVSKIAAAHNATTAQIALAWLLRRSPNIILIPGTKSLEHLKENLEAEKINLTEEEVNELT
ncbi:MAG: aldo/keto reductase [Bacteroidetes bacterium]|nr:aldo/keto reductase [Bacteroidota bacterium]